MIPMKPEQGTASNKRLIVSTRPTADAPDPPGRGESVTPIEFPLARSLRRCWAWRPVPLELRDSCIQRVAHHEAAHVVLLEWVGLRVGEVTATSTSGLCSWDLPTTPIPEATPDPSGELAATASAVFHAGVVGELLWMGLPWDGPLYYPAQKDYRDADDMLAAAFGRHASCAHAFAQRVALHVLSTRWNRVREVANLLVLHGRWAPVVGGNDSACAQGRPVRPKCQDTRSPALGSISGCEYSQPS